MNSSESIQLDSRPLSSLDSWQAILEHFKSIESVEMKDLFAADNNRFDHYQVTGAGITADYSKNRITHETLPLLFKLAEDRGLNHATEQMFSGAAINHTEGRAVLHTALRNFSNAPVLVNGNDVMPEIQATWKKMEGFCNQILKGEWKGATGKTITDVVSIGIGGSFLGPMMAAEALKPFWLGKIHCHYLANVDGTDAAEILKQCDPETTLFIVQSKSFGTQETLQNAKACREWLMQIPETKTEIAKHFVAVSANVEKAVAFGIDQENIFPMWDWVGGRYSLWSAIGLPLALTIGYKNFERLLKGAFEMDQHFRTSPLEQNLPVILGLLGVWYGNAFGVKSHTVLPYDQYLQRLTDHLQQLDMESNGKSVLHNGDTVSDHTGPIIWGGAGTNGQHAYHQLLHQGSHFSPCDFILPLTSHNPLEADGVKFHSLLAANCFGQSQALMQGKSLEEAKAELQQQGLSDSEIERIAPHKVIPGNRPSNTLFFDQTTPEIIGALIALYEHKVFVQGVMWGINSFDQWGVELGKQLGDKVLAGIDSEGDSTQFDPSTNGLVNLFKQAAKR